MNNLQERINQVNEAEIFWRNVAQPMLKNWFISLGERYLQGEKIWLVGGTLTKKLDLERIELQKKIDSLAPSNVRGYVKVSYNGYGSFFTFSIIQSYKYTVKSARSDSTDTVDHWYLSMSFNESDIESFKKAPIIDAWEPLTVEYVELTNNAIKQVEEELKALEEKAYTLKSKLYTLNGRI